MSPRDTWTGVGPDSWSVVPVGDTGSWRFNESLRLGRGTTPSLSLRGRGQKGVGEVEDWTGPEGTHRTVTGAESP